MDAVSVFLKIVVFLSVVLFSLVSLYALALVLRYRSLGYSWRESIAFTLAIVSEHFVD